MSHFDDGTDSDCKPTDYDAIAEKVRDIGFEVMRVCEVTLAVMKKAGFPITRDAVESVYTAIEDVAYDSAKIQIDALDEDGHDGFWLFREAMGTSLAEAYDMRINMLLEDHAPKKSYIENLNLLHGGNTLPADKADEMVSEMNRKAAESVVYVSNGNGAAVPVFMKEVV